MGSRHRFADVEALKRCIGEAEGDTLQAAFAPFETRSRPRLLAATRHGFTFYVADPISSIETRSLPTLTHCFPRNFTLITRSPRRPCASYLAALPSNRED